MAKTNDYTATAADSGKLIIMNKATAVGLTLPTVAAGKGCFWWVANQGAGALTITGGTADVMVGKNAAAADTAAFSSVNEIIGGCCLITCDGTNYFVFNMSLCTMTMAG